MPDPVTASIVGGSQLLGGVLGAHSANKAAGQQAAAAQAGIDEDRMKFEQMQKLLAPYVNTGNTALTGQMNLAGLSGADAQQQAIAGLASSPQMDAMLKQGENAMLQNASATGGLRGGNLQAAMAQFRPQLLNQMIQQQYSNLGGLTNMGQNSAAGTGQAGMQSGAEIANLLQQQGAARAGGTMGQGAAFGKVLNAPSQFLGMQYGAGAKTGFGF